jgi:hypothetical protein
MIAVYKVIPDVNNFQSALADDVQAIMQYNFDGSEIGASWQKPSTYRSNPKKPQPDFWGCFANPAVFAVTPEAAKLIVTFLGQSCECLPIEPAKGRKLFLCNVTCVVEALDEANSPHKEGLPHWIEKYVFHRNRFEYSLFKIPATAMSEVLCVEGLADPNHEFKGTVERHALKGLKFEKIWSD